MSKPKKEKRVTIEQQHYPEPADAGGFDLYVLEKGLGGYVPGCHCYACNANRQYFEDHWKVQSLPNGGAK